MIRKETTIFCNQAAELGEKDQPEIRKGKLNIQIVSNSRHQSVVCR